MSARDTALAYAYAFCEGQVDDVSRLLHDAFTLDGPLYRCSDAASYLSTLRSDSPEPGGCTILHVVEGPGSVAILCDYSPPKRTVRRAQFFVVQEDRIVRTMLTFGTESLKGHAI